MAFLAKYDGRCPGCPDDIIAGFDDIVMVDGLAYHADCAPVEVEKDGPQQGPLTTLRRRAGDEHPGNPERAFFD